VTLPQISVQLNLETTMKKSNTSGNNLRKDSPTPKQNQGKIPLLTILWDRRLPNGEMHATFALTCLIELFYFPN